MCIIVYKPKGKKLDKDTLAECHRCNNDGMGFVYPAKKHLVIEKELDSFEKIYYKYKTRIIDKLGEEEVPVIWHFRIATHGEHNLKNCHPFAVPNHNMAFAHNGIIKGMDVPTRSPISDSLIFKHRILDNLPKNWYLNPAMKLLIKEWIGYSKLAFMKKDGSVFIINEDKGEWDKGIWYSNASYKIVSSSYNYRNRRVWNGYNYGDDYYDDGYPSTNWKNGGHDSHRRVARVLNPQTNKWEDLPPANQDNFKQLPASVPINLKKEEITEKAIVSEVIESSAFKQSLKEDIMKTYKGRMFNYCKICLIPVFSKQEVKNGLCYRCKNIVAKS